MPASVAAQLLPSFEEAASIQRFWDQHYPELLADYPDKFVAVANGVVVASNSDLALLIYDLRDKGLNPRTDVAIEYISSKSATLLL